MRAALLVALCLVAVRGAAADDVLEVGVQGAITFHCNENADTNVSHWRHLGHKEEMVMSYLPANNSYTCRGSLASETTGCRKGVKIDTRTGQYITIRKPVMADAGTYVCVMADSTIWTTYVTVVNITSLALHYTSDTTNFTRLGNGDIEVEINSKIDFSCSVSFTGARRPYMELRTWNYWRHDHLLERAVPIPDDILFHWRATETLSGSETMVFTGNSMFPSPYYRVSCYLPNITETPYDEWFKIIKTGDASPVTEAGGLSLAAAHVTIVIGIVAAIVVVSFTALLVGFCVHRRRSQQSDERQLHEPTAEASVGLLPLESSPKKTTSLAPFARDQAV